jgi:hypothetical protein
MAAVIRFLPDTWRDALLRPIAMAAPDAGVYVEIMAPDARFAFIAALVLIWAALAWRRKWRLSPVLVLLMFVSAAFVVWLATTGNGRYFTPVLLAAGPLCIALIHQLPSTQGFRVVIAAVAVGIQAFIVHQNNPWHSWQLAPWSNAPFFDVTLDREALTVPSTYVTVTNISYSLIAPRFPASSRWVNISSLPSAGEPSPDVNRMQVILASSKSLKLLIPSRPDFMTAQGLPTEELRETINGMLGMQRLALARSSDCRLLPSKGLASEALKDVDAARPATVAKFGFWVCALKYPVAMPTADAGVDVQVRRAFETIENHCPRFFQPGQTSAARLQDGWMRIYPQADIKLYVLDDGRVFYKYLRALNPVLIGNSQALQRGEFKLDCNAIRGRSGLPWEREI